MSTETRSSKNSHDLLSNPSVRNYTQRPHPRFFFLHSFKFVLGLKLWILLPTNQ